MKVFEGRSVILDGAMGSRLMDYGIEMRRGTDYQNIESPDLVFDIHRAYIEAGCDAILTNTFGGNKYALARHGFIDKVREMLVSFKQDKLALNIDYDDYLLSIRK